MIELMMYFGIGFFSAALSMLVLMPLVHGRAVRLTRQRLEDAIPSSITEVLAGKDLLRAEFAMSTRRLEMNIEQLKTKSAGQLAELGKKGDVINHLNIELGTLRDRLSATEEEVAVKATAVQEAERALSDKKTELAKLMGELNERSTLADAQKIEIIALETRIEELKERLDGANNEMKAVEDRRNAEHIELNAATQKLMEERAKVENFGRRVAELEQQLVEQTTTLKERLAQADEEVTAVNERRYTEHTELKAATQKLMEERGKVENFGRRVAELEQQLVAQATALTEKLTKAGEEVRAVKASRDAERIELKAATQKLMKERAKGENIGRRVAELEQQLVEQTTLKERLVQADEEVTAVKNRRDAERIELEAATQKLMEERGRFEGFRRRTAELVRQLVAQAAEDKRIGHRIEDLESRLAAQSQLLNESESELKHLRREIDITRKAEAGLRSAMKEIESRASENLRSEKEKLEGALDRANGERMRLSYEVAILKQKANSEPIPARKPLAAARVH
jgi:chromosome segregation ATPase